MVNKRYLHVIVQSFRNADVKALTLAELTLLMHKETNCSICIQFEKQKIVNIPSLKNSR